MATQTTSKAVSTSRFRRDVEQFLMQAADGLQIRVKVNGKGNVEILSEKKARALRKRARINKKIQEWFESWQETQEILADPVIMDGIRRSEEDIKVGRVVTLDELKVKLGL
jgi:PHD/YefM family antitoxin component YafN of YafNO toxin-antitoxin module